MAKNMTRKGLAIGAAGLLASSVLVSAPAAFANSDLQVRSVAGTNQAFVSGEAYAVTVFSPQGGIAFGGAYDLTWEIENPDTVDLTVRVSNNGGDAYTDVTLSDPDAETVVVDANDSEDDTTTEGGASQNWLEITVPSDVATTLSVTAFLNTDGVEGLDGEPASAPFEISFIEADDVSWNLDFTAPVLGDTEFAAELSANVNVAQLTGLEVGFARVDSDGDHIDVATDSTVAGDPARLDSGADVDAYDSADGNARTATDGVATAISASTPYVAQAFLGATAVGSPVFTTVGTQEITSFDLEQIEDSADSKANVVRTGATSVVFSAVAKNTANTENIADAGLSVDVTITEVFDDNADASLTAGGETLTEETTDDKIEFTVTTGEDGVIEFPITLSGEEVEADGFKVELSAFGVPSTDVDVTFADTAVASFHDHNIVGESGIIKVTEGSSYAATFAALDNFDQPLTGNYEVTLDDGDVDTTPLFTPMVNGVASFNVTDDADIDESWTATLLSFNTTTGRYDTNEGEVDLAVTVGESNAPSSVELAVEESGDRDLLLSDIVAANERLGEVAATGTDAAAAATLTGTVKDANGIGTYSQVTISAPGMLFEAATPTGVGADNVKVYTVDSATVVTNAIGQFEVVMFGNTAGDVEVVASAAGVDSEAVEVTFDAATADTGANLELDVPNSVLPGSTLTMKAMLTDEYGNPVATSADEVTVSYDGPGFIVGTGLTSASFDADGEITVTVFLGNNDGGKTGTLTVAYDGDNDADTTDDNITKQATVAIGTSVGTGAFNAWTKLVENDTAVKFYAKNPSAEGKIQFLFNGEEIAWHRGTTPTSYEGGALRYNEEMDAYYLVRDVELVSGMKNTFEIYQDGTRIWRAVKTVD